MVGPGKLMVGHQALVGPGLATPLPNNSQKTSFLLIILCKLININFRDESLKEFKRLYIA